MQQDERANSAYTGTCDGIEVVDYVVTGARVCLIFELGEHSSLLQQFLLYLWSSHVRVTVEYYDLHPSIGQFLVFSLN